MANCGTDEDFSCSVCHGSCRKCGRRHSQHVADPREAVQKIIKEMKDEDWSEHTTHPASVEAVVDRWAERLQALTDSTETK